MFSTTGRAAADKKLFRALNISLGALLPLLFFTPAFAQGGGIDLVGTGGKHRVQGRIFFPSGRRADATIKVTLQSTSSENLSVIADPNGSFAFSSIAPGSYTLTVEGGEDYETARESLNIEELRNRRIPGTELARTNVPRVFNIPIYLQLKRGGGSKVGVLNAALADVPEPARGLYTKALESARTGNSGKAVEQLKEALSHHPDFALALNELGVQYLKLNQPDKAAEALRSAVKISPEAFSPRLNYGIALLEKREFVEAETQFRQALKKNDASWAGHMYLGVTLISLRKYDEAEKELLRSISLSSVELSLPHYYLGGIYWGRKQYKRAADELEKYLRLSPNVPDAERIRTTIKELRAK